MMVAAAALAMALLAPGGQAADPYQPDVIAPTVVITKAPKSKLNTHKRRKRVKFKFTSDDPLATFTCRVDRGSFTPCTSPVVLHLKAGKRRGMRHTFLVRSADLTGNSSGGAVRSLRVARKHPYKR